MPARELDCGDDVGGAGALCNEPRPLVDRAVPELARLVVVGVVATDGPPPEPSLELGDGGFLQRESLCDGSHGLSVSPDARLGDFLPSTACRISAPTSIRPEPRPRRAPAPPTRRSGRPCRA